MDEASARANKMFWQVMEQVMQQVMQQHGE